MSVEITRLDYYHPQGGVVASMVWQDRGEVRWMLEFPEKSEAAIELFRRSDRWHTKAETVDDARTCLERVGALVLAWHEHRTHQASRLEHALDQAVSRVGVTQEPLPLGATEQAQRIIQQDIVRTVDDAGAEPHCPAHGQAQCPRCSRTHADDGRGNAWLDEAGDCRGCGYYGVTGMHWDTCPARVR